MRKRKNESIICVGGRVRAAGRQRKGRASEADMKEDSTLKRLKSVMLSAKNAVVFTGAGVSVPSGIPDFRSAGGVYDGKFAGYPAEYMLSHDCLVTRPELFFDFYKTKMIYPSAKPNAAHLFFAELERRGKLLSVVTQNIDGLHQDAGSERVWELHGSVRRNRCEGCGASYDEKFVLASEGVPKCPKCGGRVRPCVVLYGENLDSDVLDGAVRDISRADVLLIAGTSLAVYPAAALPDCFNGKELVLINKTPTARDGIATLAVYGDVAEIAKYLAE